jgi:protein SCO1/2
MPAMRAALVACLISVLTLLGLVRVAHAQVGGMPPELQHVGVNEHLDALLPLDTQFRDHTGKSVRLRDYYDGKRPVILTFAYHSCPVLCSMVLNATAAGLKGVGWTVGKEFDVVTISIDPEESLEKTASKRASILDDYGASRGHDGNGWHFLVGDKASIAAVAAAAGFEYEYDPEIKQWGHPSVVMITKPDGRMARYLYGLEFPSNDLKIGLLEASEGRSMTTVEQIILYCYHYDPKGGKYVLVAMRVMQVGGGAVALVLFGILGLFWGRELRKSKKTDTLPSESPVDAVV